MEAKTALLEGRNLRKTYRISRRNQVEALRGVQIEIQPGEMGGAMGRAPPAEARERGDEASG